MLQVGHVGYLMTPDLLIPDGLALYTNNQSPVSTKPAYDSAHLPLQVAQLL